jgi:hypothetical protein
MEGSHLWTEGALANPLEEAMIPNGLIIQRTFQSASYNYFQVDLVKTDMSSMYTYKECELTTDMLCWHTFYIITDLKGSLWINVPEEHTFLNPILKAHYVDM